MKQPAVCALLLFVCSTSPALSQTGSKPTQFSRFPDVINCPESLLATVFSAAPGQDSSLSFSTDFSFSGTVVSNVVKYSNLRSAVIRSPYFNNSVFSISQIINSDNSYTYTGRIINKNYFDGYELKQHASGGYQFVKVETDQVIPDCLRQ